MIQPLTMSDTKQKRQGRLKGFRCAAAVMNPFSRKTQCASMMNGSVIRALLITSESRLKIMSIKPIVAGGKYGRLTAIQRDSTCKKWECVCKCGNRVFVRAAALNNGNTKSCGCLQRDATRVASTKHGMSDTKLHKVWISMRQRCRNKTHKSYQYYGGRGITVCDEWLNSFESFCDWAMNNGYAEGLQIDRIDGDGNYEPSNCQWVTPKVNNNHRRLVRNSHGQYASVE